MLGGSCLDVDEGWKSMDSGVFALLNEDRSSTKRPSSDSGHRFGATDADSSQSQRIRSTPLVVILPARNVAR
ncbi:hypothetical protein LshimejAT787_0905650 [Lyophyllum shimeji]|uniref:Uncharacterized protein n=1 Tax=Lyophyllum shimeji TaxID=47721 RepID=A0A9P3URH8_LYOSH|nr:hypothetical protein LshimejAT787_0905650 [Lyophyllum shimeji]